MRCPACGARNAERAEWCTQCFATLETGGTAETPGTVAGPAADGPYGTGETPAGEGDRPAVVPPDDLPPVGVPASSVTSSAGRDVRVRDEVVEWRCPVCDTWSTLGAGGCRGCGRPPDALGQDRSPPERTAPRPLAVGAEVVMPGVGHLLAGAVGSGLARLVLWVVWAGGSLSLLRGGTPGAPGLVLVLAAAGLWVVSQLDLRRLLAEQPPVLTGRRLSWSVVVVTLLLVLGVLVSSRGVVA